jgi:hypothetical protein
VEKALVKGTDFLLLVFFDESVSPKPLIIPLGPFRILSKILGDIRSSRFATGVIDTGGKWKKSSIRKIFIIFFWTPLDSRVSIYIIFFSSSF